MKPLISICIPAYNNADYIAETINSVLSQSYKNFELIITDDCSKDDTVKIVKSFSDERIKLVINDSNLGMHGNWNKVLSLAKGDYMKLLCGDDLITPDCLEKQVAEFLKPGNEDVAVVACRRKIIKADGKVSMGAFYKFKPGKYKNAAAVKKCVAWGANLIGEPMAVLFKGKVYRENKIVLGSNNYLIDMDMYTKVLVYGNLVVQDEFLAFFRIYGGSMSSALGFKHARYLGEFISQQSLKDNFGVTQLNVFTGKVLAFFLSFARNMVLMLNRK